MTKTTKEENVLPQEQMTDDDEDLVVGGNALGNRQLETILADPDIEVSFETREIPLTAIDEKRSKENQARPVPINQETVERYATAMRKGDRFPRLVVQPFGKGYVIFSGNHRYAAAKKASISTIGVYVLATDTPAEKLGLLVLACNRQNGLPVEENHTMREAARLLGLGVARELVAKASGLATTTLVQVAKALEAQHRSLRLGLREYESLAMPVQYRLGMIALDVVFMEAARLAIRLSPEVSDKKTKAASVRFTQKDAEELVKVLRTIPDEHEQLRHLGTVGEEFDTRLRNAKITKRHAPMPIPKQTLLSGCGAIMSVDPESLLRLYVTEEEIRLALERVEPTAVRLMEIEDVLQKALRRRT